MSDTKTCTYCGCVLTIGKYEFLAHTDEFCKRGTLYRIQDLTRMLTKSYEEVAILRDMMGRHECAPRREGE
jgi:hypothetical protein